MKLRKDRWPLTRRQRLLRDGVLLLLSLALLAAALDFPIPTAELARRATERRSFFGPSQVLGVVEEKSSRRTYAVRWEDWYGLVEVYQDGFFWDTGTVTAVENAPDISLVSTTPNGEFRFFHDPVCVFSNDPEIVKVTVEVPVWAAEAGTELHIYGQDAPVGNCFVLDPPAPEYSSYQYSSYYRLSGYDAGGELVWRSPTPAEWAAEFDNHVN